ncbi:MAG: ClpXP protease specificity-enhancing factor SspB [Magnetococcus sp. DMHC-8]
MHDQPLPDKASVIRLLLETEGRVMVCLDATRKGVEVPRRFCTDPGLMLVFNINMPQPIEILPEHLASELRFGGIPHYCVVPYTAIWSIFNPDTHHGLIWPEEMPAEVRATHGVMQLPLTLPPGWDARPVQPAAAPVADCPAPAQKQAPFLWVIDGGGGREQAGGEALIADRPSARRPHLRLVE